MYNCDDKNQIYPLHVSNEEKSDHFDLLQRTKHISKIIICKRCFSTFSNKPLDQHALDSHKVVIAISSFSSISKDYQKQPST
ncbi:Uncharacterized protein FWK35_00009780 [Aphis craccivora]|uniref:C2H2-type domain-containing protein n=1 Tax=Aphis craccivora TaxID=307492 RepID=A0A6G0YNK5_APHCR|nr:Uncharacterized protein FWK35_00009780 [Aphis craccivora]